MESSPKSKDYEQVIEKIVFDEEELEELKIAIRKFSSGILDAKHLKHLLLQYRGRIVNDVSQFLNFCIQRINNDGKPQEDKKVVMIEKSNQKIIQLQQEISKKNDLLKEVANKVSNLVENLKNK